MQTTWNFAPLISDPSAAVIKKELDRVRKQTAKFIKKWQKRTDYLKNPKILAEALGDYENWRRHSSTSGALGYYLTLRLAQETNNPELQALQTKIDDASTANANAVRFFTHTISLLPPATQKKFLTHPALALYRPWLKQKFAQAKYLLSEAEEKIIALNETASHSRWVEMVERFLSLEERSVLVAPGKSQTLSLPAIASLFQNPNREIRQSAALAANDIYRRHREVAEAELNAICHTKKINDELRGFKRPDAGRHLRDNIETEIVDALIESTVKNFSIARKYYDLKTKLLGITDPAYYDRTARYGTIDKTYPYPEALELVTKVLRQLDPQFAEITQNFASRGQIDVFPRKGKIGGAFCAYNLPIHPVYILLNHTGSIRDVTTLAHELGHGINDELIKAVQPAIYASTPLCTAEVASTFMESFVLDEIAQNATEEERLVIMLAELDDTIASTFRQIALYRFEQDLHNKYREKGYLPAGEIEKLFKQHMEKYLGPLAKESELGWVSWSHIRRFFYVYSYASGLLISKALQAKVRHDHDFIKEVKKFLSAGSSDTPKNLFKKLGLNISEPKFWDDGYREINRRVRAAEALAKKLGKI